MQIWKGLEICFKDKIISCFDWHNQSDQPSVLGVFGWLGLFLFSSLASSFYVVWASPLRHPGFLVSCPRCYWKLRIIEHLLLPRHCIDHTEFDETKLRKTRSLSLVQFSHWVVSDSLRPHGLHHTRPPCSSPTPIVYSNSCPWNQWCHSTISFSAVPFSSCLQYFPASESFPMSQFFISGDQSVGVSASASVPPMTIQDWFLLGRLGWISLQSKGLSRVFSNTTDQKHQFFSAQLSL